MKWDMPIRPIESGPLTDREIEELNAFLLAEDGLENPMDFYTFDGFICAVLSAPNAIMPSEWLRWVWDQEQGEQTPEFSSEKQAKRILSLLIGHANVLAFTLIHGPQHYEPLFYSHKIEGNSVPIIDEWCCGYVKGIALNPEGWQPLIDARPDWFEVIHLYGTKSGWERLKELVDAHENSVARHQAFVDRIAPAARNIHAYWLARRAPREKSATPAQQGACSWPQRSMPVRLWQEVQALPRGTANIALSDIRRLQCYLTFSGASASLQRSSTNCLSFGSFNFLTIRRTNLVFGSDKERRAFWVHSTREGAH